MQHLKISWNNRVWYCVCIWTCFTWYNGQQPLKNLVFLLRVKIKQSCSHSMKWKGKANIIGSVNSVFAGFNSTLFRWNWWRCCKPWIWGIKTTANSASRSPLLGEPEVSLYHTCRGPTQHGQISWVSHGHPHEHSRYISEMRIRNVSELVKFCCQLCANKSVIIC